MPTDYSKPLKKKKRTTVPTITSGPFAGLPTPGVMAAHEVTLPKPPSSLTRTEPGPLKVGVQGYQPVAGTQATLPPDIESQIRDQIKGMTGGPIDQTLANLTMAHYKVFNSWPSWSLTADILDSGEVEFATFEEALQFFQAIKRSYATSGKEWQLDAQGPGKLISGNERAMGKDGFTQVSDVLDPEMLASWAPKKVEDFLYGPYMKTGTNNRVTGMAREGRLRLDEMLIELPKQWAISNLSQRLEARSLRFNPDRHEDEGLMIQLNNWLASRVPKEYAPAANAVWQQKTEDALRMLQQERASAIYIATDGKDQDAAAFLHTRAFGNIIDQLENYIRMPADPTGEGDKRKRAMVTQMWVNSRSPGVSERMAVHELADLNVNALSVEGQRLVGADHMAGYAGAIKGWFEDVPVLEQIGDVFQNEEFQKAIRPAVSLAGDIVNAVKPAVVIPVGAFAKAYDYWDVYRDAFLSTLRDDNAVSVVAKMLIEGPFALTHNPLFAERKANGDIDSAWSQFFAIGSRGQDESFSAQVGDFIEEFKTNLKTREEGKPTGHYWDAVLNDWGVNPTTHPELAFLAQFAGDTLIDFVAFKGIGLVGSVAGKSRVGLAASNTARSVLHQETIVDTTFRTFKEYETVRKVGIRESTATGAKRGAKVGAHRTRQWTSDIANLFGIHPLDARDLAIALREAAEQGFTDDGLKDIIRAGFGTPKVKGWIARTGKRNLNADSWGLHYRLREKVLMDPSSFLYRGKHSHLNLMTERLFSDPVIALTDEDNLAETVRNLGFRYRTGLKPEEIQKAIRYDIAKAFRDGDYDLTHELYEILDSGDLTRYASVMEGTFIDARSTAERILRRTDYPPGTPIPRGVIDSALIEERAWQTDIYRRKIEEALLRRSAPKRFTAKWWKKDPQWAAEMHELAKAIDPNIADDFLPEKAVWERYNRAKQPPEKLAGKGETFSSYELGGEIYLPKHGEPTVMRDFVDDNGEVVTKKVVNEQSVSIDYDAANARLAQITDVFNGDPKNPGLRDLLHELGLATPEETDRFLLSTTASLERDWQAAMNSGMQAITNYVKALGTLDEKLAFVDELRTRTENAQKALDTLAKSKGKKGKAGSKARKKAAAATDQARNEEVAATVAVLKDEVEGYKAAVDLAAGNSAAFDATLAKRAAIRARIQELNDAIGRHVVTESERPEAIALLTNELESQTRKAYEAALDRVRKERQLVQRGIEASRAQGIPIDADDLKAAREGLRILRRQAAEARAIWRSHYERRVHAEIALQQGVFTGANTPQATLVDGLYDLLAPGQLEFGRDIPAEVLQALTPPPEVLERYYKALREYGEHTRLEYDKETGQMVEPLEPEKIRAENPQAKQILVDWVTEQLYGTTKRAEDEVTGDLTTGVTSRTLTPEELEAVRRGETIVTGPLEDAAIVAERQAGGFMERNAAPSERKIKGTVEDEQEFVDPEDLADDRYTGEFEEMLQQGLDPFTARVVEEPAEVIVPPSQAFHDAIAQLCAIAYQHGELPIKLPRTRWQSVSAGSPENLYRKKSVEPMVGGEVFPETTAKRAPVTTVKVLHKDGKVVLDAKGNPIPVRDSKGKLVYESHARGGARAYEERADAVPVYARDAEGNIIYRDEVVRTPVLTKSGKRQRRKGGELVYEEKKTGRKVAVVKEEETVISRVERGKPIPTEAQGYKAPADLWMWRFEVEPQGRGAAGWGEDVRHTVEYEDVGGDALAVERQAWTGGGMDPAIEFNPTFAEVIQRVVQQHLDEGAYAPIVTDLPAVLAERQWLQTQLLSTVTPEEFHITRIGSGAQKGADIGGLLAGLDLGLPTSARAFRGFKPQGGAVIPEGVTKEVVGTDLKTRTIANVRDHDFSIVFTAQEAAAELLRTGKGWALDAKGQVLTSKNGTRVFVKGGTGLTVRELEKAGKPYLVVSLEDPDSAAKIRGFLKGRRGSLNVAGQRQADAERVREALVKALGKSEPDARVPAAAKPTPLTRTLGALNGKQAVPLREGEIVIGKSSGPYRATLAPTGPIHHRDGTTVAKQYNAYKKTLDDGLRAGPGNPIYDDFVDLAEKVRRGEVTAIRVPTGTDFTPNWADHLIKRINQWIEKKPEPGVVERAEDVVANAPGSSALPLSAELRATMDSTLEELHGELRSMQNYVEAKRKEIAEAEEQLGPLEEMEFAPRGLQDTGMLRLLFLQWDKRLLGRREQEVEELQARFDDALALAGRTETELDAQVLQKEIEQVLYAASEEGKRRAEWEAHRNKVIDEASELFSDGAELNEMLQNERRGLERMKEAAAAGENWGDDETWAERIAGQEAEIANMEKQLAGIEEELAAAEKRIDELHEFEDNLYNEQTTDPYSHEDIGEEALEEPQPTGYGSQYGGVDTDTGEGVPKAPVEDERTQEWYDAEARSFGFEGLPPTRVIPSEAAKKMPASAKRKAATPVVNEDLRKLQNELKAAEHALKLAEQEVQKRQRAMAASRLEMQRRKTILANHAARIHSGTAKPISERDLEIIKGAIDWIDGGVTTEQLAARVRRYGFTEDDTNSLSLALDLLRDHPESIMQWAVQPSREWQLKLWHSTGFNGARLAKFRAGGIIRKTESMWANKILLHRWSVDDFTTAYKTLVMMKISTMLRITMADEFTRLFAERINPIEALKGSRALKALDKLPEDIQFKLSDMIRGAVDGPVAVLEVSHPRAFLAYRHLLVNDRRDRTYARFLYGRQLTTDEKVGDIQEFLAGTDPRDEKLRQLVREYYLSWRGNETVNAKDLMRAWYALGYKEDNALYRVATDTHRIVKLDDAPPRRVTLETDATGATSVYKEYGPGKNVYADARGLVEGLVDYYDWWLRHPQLKFDWQPTRRFTQAEMQTFRDGDMRMPRDMTFGDQLRPDGEPSKKAWRAMVQMVRDSAAGKSREDITHLVPGIYGKTDGTLTGGIPVVRTVRDTFYRILDYSGSKLNEMVFAHAYQRELDDMIAAGYDVERAERNAVYYAREYTHRVMFNNSVYMGEDMLRNLFLFLPAYRQFLQYWVPYLAKHPFALTLAYRANRDKDQFQDMRVGPVSLDLSRMSFLINQGDNRITGWLPSGAPLISLPVSALAMGKEGDDRSLWGNLAGNWPFEYSGSYMPLNSPVDKVIYGLFGKTLPWPFGSDGSRNPWRELQMIRAAALKGEKMTADEAYWKNRMNRLKEGGWNFIVPLGMRFIDDDVEEMQASRANYNNAKTAAEAEQILAANPIFKTFIEWQNKPSYEQQQFLKEHPEIVPYVVSGFEGRRTNEGNIGFLWSKMRDVGVADPAGYVERLDEKVRQINTVIETLDARKARDREVKWWENYRRKHIDDHDIYRLTNEWQNSEGAFGPGGVFFQQGHIGYAARSEALNTTMVGITDPFVGISNYTGDAYRYAKFMDEVGGAARALLQMSPNYEMYVLQKLKEHTDQTKQLLSTWRERRMTTRLTPEEIGKAGYNPKQVETITRAVASIDQLWDAADKACAKYGKYGYATTEGRAIRKQALQYQNGLIESSPLLKKFLGDNVASLYGQTYLTKPAYEREDLVRLDKMDKNEREMFYHLTSEKDPDTGKARWNGLYLPEKEKALIEGAKVLGYVPSKQGWLTKVQVGEVTGLIKGKLPDEAGTIDLTFKRMFAVMKDAFDKTPDTVAADAKWYAAMRKSLPAWAERLVEDGIRAEAWRYWLEAATMERHNLRTTINEYYSDAPGYSLQSKYGMRVKKRLLAYGKVLGDITPAFKREFSEFNARNEMVNSILGWYL